MVDGSNHSTATRPSMLEDAYPSSLGMQATALVMNFREDSRRCQGSMPEAAESAARSASW